MSREKPWIPHFVQEQKTAIISMSRNDSIISQFDNRNKTSLEKRYHELDK